MGSSLSVYTGTMIKITSFLKTTKEVINYLCPDCKRSITKFCPECGKPAIEIKSIVESDLNVYDIIPDSIMDNYNLQTSVNNHRYFLIEDEDYGLYISSHYYDDGVFHELPSKNPDMFIEPLLVVLRNNKIEYTVLYGTYSYWD